MARYRKTRERALCESATVMRDLGFGEPTDTDALRRAARLVFDEVTANLNLDEIPEKLERLYFRMVAGEYLLGKYRMGELTEYYLGDETDPMTVTGVNLGDMTVNTKAGKSRQTAFEEGLNALRYPMERQSLFNVYRVALT